MLNIGMKEARLRLREGKCLACGKPQTNVELNSCSDPKCIKELRPVYQWTRKIARILTSKVDTTYIGYSA